MSAAAKEAKVGLLIAIAIGYGMMFGGFCIMEHNEPGKEATAYTGMAIACFLMAIIAGIALYLEFIEEKS